MIRLKNSLNTFFEETGKTIEITGDGNIEVILPNGDKNSIFNLSSGEKQLIILFGHVIFSSDINGIFIIDEPELSLHLSWQEKFVKALLEANPSTQFILATHAPAIINETNSLNKCVNLSKK
jgi:predicted ATP-binding protein involved in virulence